MWDRFVAIIVFVDVIRTPHGDLLLTGFAGLQRAEARLIKSTKTYVIVHYYGVRKDNT